MWVVVPQFLIPTSYEFTKFGLTATPVSGAGGTVRALLTIL